MNESAHCDSFRTLPGVTPNSASLPPVVAPILAHRACAADAHPGWLGLTRSQRGVVAITTALMMSAVLAVAALAVDIGHILVARTQIQNAVEAASLYGASQLYSPGSATPNFSPNGPAVTGATQTVGLNQSVGSQDNLTVQANYWQKLNSSAPSNEAAVQVSLVKQVNLYFARIFGVSSVPITASSTAVVQTPTQIGAGGTNLPLAINSCMMNYYWDSKTDQPKLDPSTNQPYILQIGSYYGGSNPGGGGEDGDEDGGSGSCATSAQWSPLSASEDESDKTLDDILTNGNSASYAVSNNLWIANGTKDNLYSSVNDCSAAGNRKCEYSVIPVVGTVSPGSEQSVTALSCLHVLSATSQGNHSCITAQLSGGCTPNNASGSGLSYGVVEAPKLAE